MRRRRLTKRPARTRSPSAGSNSPPPRSDPRIAMQKRPTRDRARHRKRARRSRRARRGRARSARKSAAAREPGPRDSAPPARSRTRSATRASRSSATPRAQRHLVRDRASGGRGRRRQARPHDAHEDAEKMVQTWSAGAPQADRRPAQGPRAALGPGAAGVEGGRLPSAEATQAARRARREVDGSGRAAGRGDAPTALAQADRLRRRAASQPASRSPPTTSSPRPRSRRGSRPDPGRAAQGADYEKRQPRPQGRLRRRSSGSPPSAGALANSAAAKSSSSPRASARSSSARSAARCATASAATRPPPARRTSSRRSARAARPPDRLQRPGPQVAGDVEARVDVGEPARRGQATRSPRRAAPRSEPASRRGGRPRRAARARSRAWPRSGAGRSAAPRVWRGTASGSGAEARSSQAGSSVMCSIRKANDSVTELSPRWRNSNGSPASVLA